MGDNSTILFGVPDYARLVAGVTAGNSGIIIGGTPTAPTVGLNPASPLLPEVVAGTNITSVVKTFGLDGHAIYTVNAAGGGGGGTVNSVTAGNASIVIGGTAVDPTVAVAPNFVTTAPLSGLLVTGGPTGPYNLALDPLNFPALAYWQEGTSVVATKELSSWTPINAAADVDIALLPKGVGGISMRNYATSTTVGGFSLGDQSVDLQGTGAIGNVGYVTGANAGVFAGLQGIVTGASSVILGGGTATVGQGNTVNAAQSAIVAGIQGVINVGSINSVVAGGAGNVIGDVGVGTNQRSVIIGGNLNTIQNGTAAGINNFIVGGLSNIVGDTVGNFAGTSCGIVGGGFNQITGASLRSIILGGGSNVFPAAHVITAGTNAAILGGTSSAITSASNSTVVGGTGHNISGSNATAIGGQTHTANATHSAILGGVQGTVNVGSSSSVIVGGTLNAIGDASAGSTVRSTIIGGTLNTIQNGIALGADNFMGGGNNNVIGNTLGNFAGTASVILGGSFHQITGSSSRSAIIGGGTPIIGGANTITSGVGCIIAGGNSHDLTGTNASIIGGLNHNVSSINSACFAGSSNIASNSQAVCVGGAGNVASAVNTSAVGGAAITATASGASAMGGDTNIAGAINSCVFGGNLNSTTVGATNASVLAGFGNTVLATGISSCVGGGSANALSGPTGLIAAGTSNSIAAGVSNGFIGGGTGQTAAGTNGTTNIASVGGSHTTNTASNSIMTGGFGATKSCSALEDDNKVQIAGGSATQPELITVLGRNKTGQGAIVTSALHSSQHSTSAFYMEWDDTSLAAAGLKRKAIADKDAKDAMLGYMVSLGLDGLIGKADSYASVVGVSVSGDEGIIGGGHELFYKSKYLRDDFGRIVTRPSYLESVCDLIANETQGKVSLSQEQLAKLQFATLQEICSELKPLLQGECVVKILATHIQPRQVAQLNPTFDAELPYTSRSGRVEWSAVAHSGSAVVRDDGTCLVGRRCIPKNGIATVSTSNDGFRVVSRLGANTVMILF